MSQFTVARKLDMFKTVCETIQMGRQKGGDGLNVLPDNKISGFRVTCHYVGHKYSAPNYVDMVDVLSFYLIAI